MPVKGRCEEVEGRAGARTCEEEGCEQTGGTAESLPPNEASDARLGKGGGARLGKGGARVLVAWQYSSASRSAPPSSSARADCTLSCSAACFLALLENWLLKQRALENALYFQKLNDRDPEVRAYPLSLACRFGLRQICLVGEEVAEQVRSFNSNV